MKMPTEVKHGDYVRNPDEVARRFGCCCLQELLIRFKVIRLPQFHDSFWVGKGDVHGAMLRMFTSSIQKDRSALLDEGYMNRAAE